MGKSGDYLGHKVSRYSRVVSIVDYPFWEECVKAGSVWLSWRLRYDQIKSGGLGCDCYGSTTVGESGDYSGCKASRHSRVVLIVDYSFWDECVKRGSV
jgi:hypothetical protein